MNALLRKDGTWTVYMVQVLLSGCPNDWHPAGGKFLAKIPQELRFEDARTAKSRAPFTSFGASGPCWRTTGIDLATFEEDDAVAVLQLLSKAWPNHSFRVAAVTPSEATRVLLVAPPRG